MPLQARLKSKKIYGLMLGGIKLSSLVTSLTSLEIGMNFGFYSQGAANSNFVRQAQHQPFSLYNSHSAQQRENPISSCLSSSNVPAKHPRQ
jgi:hypothetical protein